METLIEWLEEYVKYMIGVKLPSSKGMSEYDKGYNLGSYEMQIEIGDDLRLALKAEKERLANESNK